MRILALEAYDGGSHKQFLDGLIAHSGHEFTRLGLPARKWKWRMRGAAIYFVQQIEAMGLTGNDIDVIFFSSMLAGADLRALLGKTLRDKPMVCYFHENQLAYPVENEQERDYQFGFTQLTGCLAADAVWFNSQYNRSSFVAGVETLLKKMPDYVPEGIAETLLQKSKVMPLGLDDDLDFVEKKMACPPTVLWNHRWEYDKNPDDFFELFFDLDRAGVEFRLIVVGEQFRRAPKIFEAAEKLLADKILHFGYAPSREQYLSLLGDSDVVISTAHHEFYGLAVLEAIGMGCAPLLPNRLSYPELLPPETHGDYLYDSMGECRDRLNLWLREGLAPLPDVLRRRVEDLSWSKLIARFDEEFSQFS